MRKQAVWVLTTAAAALVAAGCDDSTGIGDDTLNQVEAGELAAAMTGMANELATDEFDDTQNAVVPPGGSSPLAVDSINDYPFGGAHPCEAGGKVDVDGTIDVTYDNKTKIGTAAIEATLIQDDCGIVGETHTFTTNGDPNLEFTADLRSEGGEPDGEQTVALAGAFTWRDEDDRSGRCEVDLAGTLEPDTNTRVVEGSFCGHTIELEIQSEAA